MQNLLWPCSGLLEVLWRSGREPVFEFSNIHFQLEPSGGGAELAVVKELLQKVVVDAREEHRVELALNAGVNKVLAEESLKMVEPGDYLCSPVALVFRSKEARAEIRENLAE